MFFANALKHSFNTKQLSPNCRILTLSNSVYIPISIHQFINSSIHQFINSSMFTCDLDCTLPLIIPLELHLMAPWPQKNITPSSVLLIDFLVTLVILDISTLLGIRAIQHTARFTSPFSTNHSSCFMKVQNGADPPVHSLDDTLCHD